MVFEDGMITVCIFPEERVFRFALTVYFKDARVKVEVGLCKGKKNYDKRAAASARDAKREIDRTLKERNR